MNQESFATIGSQGEVPETEPVAGHIAETNDMPEKESVTDEQIVGYRDALKGFLHNKGCPDSDLEDMTHTVLLKAIKAKDSFGGESSLWTWLCAIAKFSWIDKLRRNAAHGEVPLEYASNGMADTGHNLADAYDAESPDGIIQQSERLAAIRGLIEALPERQRLVLKDRFFGDMTYQEIADKHGMPLGSVMSTIHNAKENIGKMKLGKDILDTLL